MDEKEQQQMLERTIRYGALMQHRFSAQPVFSKTGIGYLAPTTEEDKASVTSEIEQHEKELEERLRLKKALVEFKRIAFSNVDWAQKHVDEIGETLNRLKSEKLEEQLRDDIVHSIHYRAFKAYQQFDTVVSRILKMKGIRVEKEPCPNEILQHAALCDVKAMESLGAFRKLIPKDEPGEEIVDLEANAQVLCFMWPQIKKSLVDAIEAIDEIVPRFVVDPLRYEQAMETARGAAKYLKEEKGALRVFLFGSLAMGAEYFDPDYSDIDLAFDGIEGKGDYQVTWDVQCRFKTFSVDAWTLKGFSKELQEMICKEGIPL